MFPSRQSSLPPPPPPPGAGGASAELRRLARAVAIVAFVAGAVVWLRSFVASPPTARFWDVASFPAFIVVFAVWAIMIIDIGMRSRGRPGSEARELFRLHGWRRAAAVAIFLSAWLSGMAVIFSDDVAGQTEESNGRYYSNNHGEITELTRDEWARARALNSRTSAGTVMVFDGLAALYLDPRRATVR